MADDGSPSPQNPFEGIPFLSEMMRAMSAQGPLNWDLAVQFASLGARGDDPDPDPSAMSRIEWNSLADIADLRVSGAIGLPTGPGGRHPEILTVTRAGWASRTLTDLRPLFTDLATSLSGPPAGESDAPGDPFAAMLGQFSKMMAPAMMGMSVGSMAGALARHALGQYDLPLARPESREILVVDSSVEKFAEDWSIARDDVRMWVLVHELASHAVLSSPAAVDGVMALVRRHVAAFRPDPSALMDRLGAVAPEDFGDGGMESMMESVQSMFSDPLVLLGAVRSAEQDSIAPLLDARVAAIQGYIDWTVDVVGAQLLGNTATIAEAARRRRLEYGSDARLIEGLLGLTLNRAQLTRGRTFVEGVIERDGAGHLARMLNDPALLPTPNEVDAPGLWLARLEIH